MPADPLVFAPTAAEVRLPCMLMVPFFTAIAVIVFLLVWHPALLGQRPEDVNPLAKFALTAIPLLLLTAAAYLTRLILFVGDADFRRRHVGCIVLEDDAIRQLRGDKHQAFLYRDVAYVGGNRQGLVLALRDGSTVTLTSCRFLPNPQRQRLVADLRRRIANSAPAA